MEKKDRIIAELKAEVDESKEEVEGLEVDVEKLEEALDVAVYPE